LLKPKKLKGHLRRRLPELQILPDLKLKKQIEQQERQLPVPKRLPEQLKKRRIRHWLRLKRHW
jgi:hypothetical protein